DRAVQLADGKHWTALLDPDVMEAQRDVERVRVLRRLVAELERGRLRAVRGGELERAVVADAGLEDCGRLVQVEGEGVVALELRGRHLLGRALEAVRGVGRRERQVPEQDLAARQ